MSLKLILGVNSSGKTRAVFNKINKDLEEGEGAILIVPSQMRLEIEKKYVIECSKPGILDLDITSFSRLAEKYMDTQNIDESKYISKLDKTIMLRKLIAQNKDVFKIYEKVKNKEGFWASVDILVDLFRKEGKSPEDIAAIELEDKFLEHKLKEMGAFYSIYTSTLKGVFLDSIDEMQMFAEAIKTIETFKTINVYIDGHNNFSNKEMNVLFNLASVCKNVYVTLTTDAKSLDEAIASSEYGIYSVSNQTLALIHEKAARVGIDISSKYLEKYTENKSAELAHLCSNLYKDGKQEKYTLDVKDISIEIMKNPYFEVTKIAQCISKYIRMGYRYNDFCIFTNEIEKYELPIKKILYDYDIPCYIDSKRKILTNSLIIYITAMLETVKKSYNTESIFKFLKTGLTDVAYADICYIENYTLQYNINYGKWLKEFDVYTTSEYETSSYDKVRLNSIRVKIVEQINSFKSAFSGRKVAEKVAEEIYNHITKSVVIEKYYEQIEELKNRKMHEQVSIYSQVINKVIDILDSIVKVYGGEYITFDEFSNIFEYCIKDMTVSSMPATLDEVMVANIGSTRVSSKKIIFVVGVNENKLPAPKKEDIIFSDRELEKLKEAGLDIRQTTLTKANMEEYNINLALETATEKIFFTLASSELTGEALIESSLINKIKKIFPDKIKVNGSVAAEEIIKIEESVYSRKVFTTSCIKAVYLLGKNGAIDSSLDKWASVYKEYKTDKLKDILKYYRKVNNLNEESLASIYKDTMYSTVSRLENYKACSFSYFMNYIIKAKERKIFEITSKDTGTFMHGVIEKFSEYLVETDRKWHELLINKEYEERVDKIVEEMVATNSRMFGESKKYLALKNLLTNRTKNVIKMIAESFNQSQFEQLGYEVEFKDGAIFAPIKINLNNGRTMLITGKIDRVDICKVEDKIYTRVIDYKSSHRDLTLEDVRNGMSLQLITYMNALMHSEDKIEKGAEIIPAGALYFTLASPKLKNADYQNDEEKIKSEIRKMFKLDGIFIEDIKILQLMDKEVTTDRSRINVTSKRLKDKKNILNQDEFVRECNNIENILAGIGNEIQKGTVKIGPNKNCKYSPCNFCAYGSICRKGGVC
ncbi:MAG: PD-(D/E)XK nuclease family protein [Clostridia bacterium]